MDYEDARQRCTRTLTSQAAPAAKAQSYYDGVNPIAWVSKETRDEVSHYGSLNLNYARVQVDEQLQRVGEVEGFNSSAGRADEVFAQWEANDMSAKMLLVLGECLVKGRSWASVWTDTSGRLNVSPETSDEVAGIRDPQTGELVTAYKQWVDLEGNIHGDQFIDGLRITYRGTTKVPVDSLYPHVPMPPYAQDMKEVSREPAPFIPFVQFVNRPTMTNRNGVSEISDLIPLIDMVNKFTLDQLVAASHGAFPRRYITGLFPNVDHMNRTQLEDAAHEIEAKWQNATQSRIWAAPNADTRFGQFPEASLEGYRNAILLTLAQISAVGAIPPSFISVLGMNPQSAEAMQAQEARSVARAAQKQRQWSQSVEELARLMMLISDGYADPSLRDLEAVWTPAASRSLPQIADAVTKLYSANVISREAALAECGYSPQEIATITRSGGSYVIAG